MMRFVRNVGLTLVLCGLSAGIAGADSHQAPASVKARQAVMQLNAFNLGQLGAMAKGDVAYDAAAASAAAANLLAMARLDQSAMWPEGTDSETLSGKTRALPVIWSTYPAIAEKNTAMVTAAEAMNAAAGNGLDALKAAMGGVGGACGSCHETYRAK